MPPFDRRFQEGYPVADEPGIVFHPFAPPASAAGRSPVTAVIDAGTDVILVPVTQATLSRAMAACQVTDAAELVEIALRQFADREDLHGAP